MGASVCDNILTLGNWLRHRQWIGTPVMRLTTCQLPQPSGSNGPSSALQKLLGHSRMTFAAIVELRNDAPFSELVVSDRSARRAMRTRSIEDP